MRKILFGILILSLIGLGWYLFVKPQDYQVNFKVKTFPGALNQGVKFWNRTLEGNEPIVQESIREFSQTLKFGDSTHIYTWKVKSIHDSLSQVQVNVKDEAHSLMNKIKIPFSDTDIEKRSRKTLTDFNKQLQEELRLFKVTIEGEAEIPSTYCACVPTKTTQFQKAGLMMRDLPLLDGVLVPAQVQIQGPPFIEIEKWNIQKDSITYNFCYPIIRSEKLPEHPEITYKKIFGQKALKAVYNGNYLSSDRAWYALLDYAKNNNIEVEEKPFEVFYNRPLSAGNAIEWRAEIFMPIKDKVE